MSACKKIIKFPTFGVSQLDWENPTPYLFIFYFMLLSVFALISKVFFFSKLLKN